MSKFKMGGNIDSCKKLKSGLDSLYEETLWGMGYGLDDAPYHGWVGKALENEKKWYDKLELKYKELQKLVDEICEE